MFPETAGLSLEEIDYLFVKHDEADVVEAMGSSSPALSHSPPEKNGGVNSGGVEKNADEVAQAEHVE